MDMTLRMQNQTEKQEEHETDLFSGLSGFGRFLFYSGQVDIGLRWNISQCIYGVFKLVVHKLRSYHIWEYRLVVYSGT